MVQTTANHLFLSGKGGEIVTLVCRSDLYKGKSATETGRTVRQGCESVTPWALRANSSLPTAQLFYRLPAPSYRQQCKLKNLPFWWKKVPLAMDCRFPCLFWPDELRNVLPTLTGTQREVTLLSPLVLGSSTSKGSLHIRLVQNLFFLPAWQCEVTWGSPRARKMKAQLPLHWRRAGNLKEWLSPRNVNPVIAV